jgi:ribosomal subunit interface protein
MVVRIAGTNVDLGQALRTRIDATVADTVRKYFDRGYSGQVAVSKNGRIFETDLVIHIDTGKVFEASGSDTDAYVSFEQAAERLDKQLSRYKRRLKDH